MSVLLIIFEIDCMASLQDLLWVIVRDCTVSLQHVMRCCCEKLNEVVATEFTFVTRDCMASL